MVIVEGIKKAANIVKWGLALSSTVGMIMLAEVSIGRVREIGEYPRVDETHYPAAGRYQVIGKVIRGCRGETCRIIETKDKYEIRVLDTRFSEVWNSYQLVRFRREVEKDVWRKYLIEVGGNTASIVRIEPVSEEELLAESARVEKLGMREESRPPGIWKKEGRGLFKLATITSSSEEGSYFSSKHGGGYTTDFLAAGSVWSEIFIGRDGKSSRRILKTPQRYVCWESMRIMGGRLTWADGYSRRSAELGFHELIRCRE